MMPGRSEVEAFLGRWVKLTQARDPEHAADLFQRDPAPLVTFTDGQRTHDWLDVRVRLGRDFERAIVERIEMHHLEVRELADGVFAASFVYDVHARDMWGVATVATRLASMTLVTTKDGFRIASAHFSIPPA
ncbi:MAG TPA: nuclear transport factor 2 family protein [Candidatus Thermoplasmatota archaeon]|nr:nuclear transport factor 2 family protein [Candidatus Thermoplasmatota archaeon]